MKRALTIALFALVTSPYVGADLHGSYVGADLKVRAQSSLQSELDTIFDDPALARGLIGVRIDSLTTGQNIYKRNDDKLVMPASNMKILTMTTAAEKLGWDFTYKTKLDAVGTITDGARCSLATDCSTRFHGHPVRCLVVGFVFAHLP